MIEEKASNFFISSNAIERITLNIRNFLVVTLLLFFFLLVIQVYSSIISLKLLCSRNGKCS